jgi:hypothetical protein
VRLVERATAEAGIRIGFGAGAGAIAPGTRALLAQEIRNPRAGRYTLTVRTRILGSPDGIDTLLKAFAFRLQVLGYANPKKDPREGRPFAAHTFSPAGDRLAEDHIITVVLQSQDENAYQLSQGVGVVVVVERVGPQPLVPPPAATGYLCIDSVALTFDPRPRNDEVTV